MPTGTRVGPGPADRFCSTLPSYFRLKAKFLELIRVTHVDDSRCQLVKLR